MDLVHMVVSGTLVALCILSIAILAEHVAPLERYSLHERVPGILMNGAGTALGLGLIWPLNWVWHRLGLANSITVPLWRWLEPLGIGGWMLQMAVLVAFADFLAYWRHRAEHAWFWRVHVVHHAPRELHAANDIGHPLQALYNFAFIAVPMSLIQIDGPGTPFVLTGIVILLSIYIHSPIDVHFGPLRKVIVDNRFHRIHHSVEPRHFNKNFGICLSLWDHMFGTAYEPGEEWPAVGVDGVPAPRTLADFLSLPVRRPRSGEDFGRSPPSVQGGPSRLKLVHAALANKRQSTTM